jgi:peptidoglycan/LPS O-acetylase OafA/YrhL
MKTAKLYGLDHLRALAILLVFLYHYGRLFPSPQWVTDIGKFGWTGVDLFFVLSGYLIASQLFAGIARDNHIPLKPFFIKRFFRILPGYWLVVGLYFVFPAAHEREALAPLWKYLSFTQNIGLDLRYQGTFSHAWSLCIEEQFYLLLPLVLSALVYTKQLKRAWIILVALCLTGFALRAWCWYTQVAPTEAQGNSWVYWYKWIYYPTWTRLDGLLTGISIAAVFQFRPALKVRLQQYGNVFIASAIVILTAAYFACENETSLAATVVGFPLVSLGYGVLVLGAVSNNSVLYRYRSGITTRMAVLSYAVYLTHKMVIHCTQQWLSAWHIEKESNAVFFLCIVTCLLAGYVMNWLVEKPFLKIRDRVLKKRAHS